MKRLVYILIILVMLFNSMGYLILFECNRYSIKREIKKQIKAGVDEDELIVFRVTPEDSKTAAEMEWIEEHEFRYHGKMYDVVRRSVEGDTTYFYCINDVQEEYLFAHLDREVKRQTENSPLTGKNAAKLLKNLVREAIPERIEITRPESKSTIIRTNNSFRPETDIPNIPSPPPES